MIANKNIKYINKDFVEFKVSLVDYAKTYFPTTYNDFSPASPGMMFIEMAAYVGDVLSFYLDNQIQENFLQYAKQSNNLFELAYMFGYKPNVTGVSTVNIEIYQKVPSKIIGGIYTPDFDYAYEVANGNPIFYLLKKTRKAISTNIQTIDFSFTTPEKFKTIEFNTNKFIGILDCVDTEGNKWYEVDYLGQEMVFDSIKNTNYNDPNLSQYSGDTPYLLKLKKIQRRFTTRLKNSTTIQIQFGAGTTNDVDEVIVPNPDNVGIGLPFEQTKLTTAFAPSNFLFTDTYGIAPSNTTLTFRYLIGGGASSNIPANSLTDILGNVNFLKSNLPQTSLTQEIINSLIINNPEAASGGGDGDTIEEIRQNASLNFATQLRNVTQDDYLIRALSMPSKYGDIAKAYIEPSKAQGASSGESLGILDLYVLSYNQNNKLTWSSNALKQNLVTYLSQYRMINDTINIKNAFIINIGINFDIVVLPNFNNSEVISNCISELQTYFDISNWQINQPIMLKDIYILLDKIEGVQTVKNIDIYNIVGENLGYSYWAYDISGATKSNVIYPSLDPMIFEVKYPDSDIQGRVVPL